MRDFLTYCLKRTNQWDCLTEVQQKQVLQGMISVCNSFNMITDLRKQEIILSIIDSNSALTASEVWKWLNKNKYETKQVLYPAHR